MENLYHPVSIGELNFPGNLFLAPVAGFSDAAFRYICLSLGAVAAWTEMVSCEGIVRQNKKTVDLLKKAPGEKYLAVQLFGSDPDRAAAAVRSILDFSPAVIDLNCGCPVPKVVKTGAGAALMRTPEKIAAIVAAMRSALDKTGYLHVPVTVKLRSGWDRDTLNFLEAAEAAVEAGASAVTLHPRTRKQGYSGTSDWELISRLKVALPVPVFGSGDLFTPRAAQRMLAETGCDAVMFARGAVGNPYIFRNTRALLETGREPGPPAAGEVADLILEHLEVEVALKGEAVACREMRKHACAYTRGLPGGAAIRRQLATAATAAEFREILRTLPADTATLIP